MVPLYREFERFSTTALNAYVGPKVSRYLARLSAEVKELGYTREVLLMPSSGRPALRGVSDGGQIHGVGRYGRPAGSHCARPATIPPWPISARPIDERHNEAARFPRMGDLAAVAFPAPSCNDSHAGWVPWRPNTVVSMEQCPFFATRLR